MKRCNDGLDRPQKSPASQLYWKDLLAELSRLSDRAAGLWMKMLCHMAMSSDRGKLVYEDGTPWSEEDVLMLASSRDKFTRDSFLELRKKTVFSVDSGGVIYNRRMVRDSEVSRIRQIAGNKGVAARFASDLVNQTSSKTEASGQPKSEQNEKLGQPKAEQTSSKTLARASAPSTSSSSSPLTPPPPPSRGAPADAVRKTQRTRTSRRQDSDVAPVTDGDAKYRLPNGSLDYDAMERDFQAKRANGKNGVSA